MPLSKINDCISLLDTAQVPESDRKTLKEDFLHIKELLETDPYKEAKAAFFAKECLDHLLFELKAARNDDGFDLLHRVVGCTEALVSLLGGER